MMYYYKSLKCSYAILISDQNLVKNIILEHLDWGSSPRLYYSTLINISTFCYGSYNDPTREGEFSQYDWGAH